MSEDLERLEFWYKEKVRPFLAEHLKDRVFGLDEALGRIKTLDRSVSEELAICFLGSMRKALKLTAGPLSKSSISILFLKLILER